MKQSIKHSIKTLSLIGLIFSVSQTHASSHHVNHIDFFSDRFDLSYFEAGTQEQVATLINTVNGGTLSPSLNADIEHFVELGFSTELERYNVACSDNGCLVYLSIDKSQSEAVINRAENYISSIDKQFWYDFNGKHIYEYDNQYFLVLLK